MKSALFIVYLGIWISAFSWFSAFLEFFKKFLTNEGSNTKGSRHSFVVLIYRPRVIGILEKKLESSRKEERDTCSGLASIVTRTNSHCKY